LVGAYLLAISDPFTIIEGYVGTPSSPHGAISVIVLGLWGASPLLVLQDNPRLDKLLAEFKTVKNNQKADIVTAEIWSIWRYASDPAVDWMMHESQRYMTAGELDSALGKYALIIDTAPDFAEGWHKRATVHFLLGNYPASIMGIKKTVALEPRHFGALAGLGLIYLHLGQERAALKALERALEINPHLSGARQKVIELREKLIGKKI
jgi:tetratricopeptide (TPR) repeat protein